MSITQIEIDKIVKNVARKYGITDEVLVKVYCRDEEVSDEVLDKLLKFENEIAERGIDVDEIMSQYCRDKVEIEKEDVEKSKLIEVEKVETVLKIPIFKMGEEKILNIVIKNGKISLEGNIEDICKDPNDIVIGKTTIYIKCGNTWKSLLHNLKEDEVIKIEKIVKSCF